MENDRRPFPAAIRTETETPPFPAQAPTPPEPLVLTRKMTAAEAFDRIARTCAEQFRANAPLIDPAQPEAVHRARVALRRLRSAFALFGQLPGEETAPRLREELKWLTNTLGPARDLDVLIETLPLDAASRSRLEKARADAYARAREEIASPRAQGSLADLTGWLAAGGFSGSCPGDMPAQAFAADALGRFRRKIEREGQGLTHLSDAERHTLRKDAKKLRYGVEFFAPLFGGRRRQKRAKRLLAALSALQDRLGDLNNRAIAARTLASAGFGASEITRALAGDAPSRGEILKAAKKARKKTLRISPFWR